ncbi:hypothetical protein NMY22_g8288 [Coprinellus aureogranulatus]|nr:hypothetical protein NMY22_g8288 [Coprinellus aureogranulatus]
MKFLTLLCTVAAALPVILAGPTPAISIETVQGAKTGRHIVTLKKGVGKADVLGKIASIRGVTPGTGVTHEWDAAINGFAGNFDKDTLAALQGLPGVASIVEDGIVNTTATQSNAPWGLGRINSKTRLGCADASLTYTYKYDDRAGQGVDIYIIDTGIRVTHTDFGGRAKWGATFGGYPSQDGNGHGTHCAGTAIGGRYGVAKKANVYAVKVLSDSGSGSTADVVSGLNWAVSAARARGKPAVFSMSLGGSPNTALDTATKNAVAAGFHVVVAAGNSNVDAINSSPARVPEAVTVGASNILDQRASFSNYGTLVDVFAPGQNVISAWKDSDSATASLSGTSMATPHVAGLIAYYISTEGNTTPAAMSLKLKTRALLGVQNPFTLPAGTVNNLVCNQFQIGLLSTLPPSTPPGADFRMSTRQRSGPPPLKLDLGSQRLLIPGFARQSFLLLSSRGPDDPLPKSVSYCPNAPPPSERSSSFGNIAVMVTPIYDDVEVALMGPTIAPHLAHSDRPYAYIRHPPHSPQSPHFAHEKKRPETSTHKPGPASAGKTTTSPDYLHPSPITPNGQGDSSPDTHDHDRLEPPHRPEAPHLSASQVLHSGRPPLSPTRTTSANHIFQDLKARHEAFHEAIRSYCKLLPPNPHFCRSHCSGRKRAVCIGINYVGQKHELKGCANDARNIREFLIKQYHFPPSEILMLTDDDRHNRMPTRDEMFKAMAWLVHDAKKDDSLFFHYSGHGGQVKNENGREIDGMDEDIFPVDAADAGDIIDDDLHKALVHPLPAGCRLTVQYPPRSPEKHLLTSNHSGCLRLMSFRNSAWCAPFVSIDSLRAISDQPKTLKIFLTSSHSAHGRLRSISHISKRARDRGVGDPADVICFSACKDDETSADTFSAGVAVGAMSYGFIKALVLNAALLSEQDRHQTYDELLAHLRETLIPKYHQKAQISCTQPLELERQFTL